MAHAQPQSNKPFELKNLLNLNLLLLFGLVAIFLRVTAQPGAEVAIFVTSALAIIPLAGLIGSATEDIAARLGPKVGGLLNATLGNAAELIITIIALNAGLVELVRASIVGSILGNLLLVMGLSILLGGLRHGIQVFEKRGATMNATLLVLAFFALAIPSLLDAAFIESRAFDAELFFSEGVAIILIVLYALNILYTFSAKGPARHGGGHNDAGAVTTEPVEEHIPSRSMRTAIITLALATIGIVVMSEFLVGAVEPVVEQLGWSELFVGIIIVPIVGNVAEHLVAVQVALKNRMELSMSIALGSSLQIALFVAPVLVFVSLLTPNKLLLAFTVPEIIALGVASYIGALVAEDGETNWLEGAMLLAVYIMLALAFFVLPVVEAAAHAG